MSVLGRTIPLMDRGGGENQTKEKKIKPPKKEEELNLSNDEIIKPK